MTSAQRRELLVALLPTKNALAHFIKAIAGARAIVAGWLPGMAPRPGEVTLLQDGLVDIETNLAKFRQVVLLYEHALQPDPPPPIVRPVTGAASAADEALDRFENVLAAIQRIVIAGASTGTPPSPEHWREVQVALTQAFERLEEIRASGHPVIGPGVVH